MNNNDHQIVSQESNQKKQSYKTEYYRKFRDNNLEKITEKKVCDICGGKYDYYNLSRHNKCIKHINCLKLINSLDKN